MFLRSFYQDPSNLKPAVDVMERTKIYPLGEAKPKPMQFPDASGVPANMLPVSDAGAFDQLKALVDSEGANLADPDWLGMLAAIGIVKSQPFTPDAHKREILDKAAKTAYKTSRVIGFEKVAAADHRCRSDRTGQGQGGKYLILPPEGPDIVNPEFITLCSPTNQVW